MAQQAMERTGNAAHAPKGKSSRDVGGRGEDLTDLNEDEQRLLAAAPVTLARKTQTPAVVEADAEEEEVASDEQAFDDPVMFLINKITFGPTKELRERTRTMSYKAFLEDQLGKNHPDNKVERKLHTVTNLRDWKSVKDRKERNHLWNDAKMAGVYRARYSEHQLYEMMVQLWMDHFNVSGVSGGKRRGVLYQEETIRGNAMGRFHDLLLATARAPQMLTYLDNHSSNANGKGGLNENYGRELLELHTVGGKNHNEADVVGAAKIMSGWGVGPDVDFLFSSKRHSMDRSIEVLGQSFTRPGEKRGREFIRFLASHPSTAKRISFKICSRFMSSRPPRSLVLSAAEVYLANDTDLVPVLRHILNSEEFKGCGHRKVRRPREFMVAAMRAIGAEIVLDDTRTTVQTINHWQESVGHAPWQWPDPDGYPDENAYWLDTFGLSQRWSLAAQLTNDSWKATSFDIGDLRYRGGHRLHDVVQFLALRFGLRSMNSKRVVEMLALLGHDPDAKLRSVDDRQYADLVACLLSHPRFQRR